MDKFRASAARQKGESVEQRKVSTRKQPVSRPFSSITSLSFRSWTATPPKLNSGNLTQINRIGRNGAGEEPSGNPAQPQEPQDSRASGSKSQQPPPPEPPLILLAEDDPTNYLPILDYLSAKGYRVALARDGTEALQLAETLHPGIILMDIWMPSMDGLEAIRRLRSHTDHNLASCPIIAVTAMVMRGDEERCLEAGANAYMPKPISLKSLLKTIQTLLDEAKTT